MQTDPMEEWRRLTALYSEMGDVEIRELATQISDLTEAAQQILREELKRRGIAEGPSPTAARNKQNPDQDLVGVHWNDGEEGSQTMNDGVPEDATEYTWKTGLCRCESLDEATQRAEMLRRAGIESWVQRPGARFPIPWVDEYGAGDIQINVAADQLDQARAIAAQPIPQSIIDEIKADEAAPEYKIPRCPKCKAEDPTLESVEPSNNWLCESCGYTWSDSIVDPTETQPAG